MSREHDPPNPPEAPRPPGDHNPRTDPALDFKDGDLGDLSPADYDALGFMCGLEVHQQLLTRRKLFCRCPAGTTQPGVDSEVLRHMRPTLSELGEYDGTALMEFKTRKEIVYRLERGSVCTYEIDDTPPFEIDHRAVAIAAEVAMLFDLNLVSELHVMRKQYLDGSIPTGFQRTAMVGLTGSIPFRVPSLGVDRELRIRQLSLEEDSCREVSDIGHTITFTTDRLGTPLTEVVTEPELVTPFEVQAAGRLIAAITQSTRKVRRGPGAARQDVNVSVAGGRRVEIKGVDNHRNLPRLVHIEAFRQLNLLRVREELRRRGVSADLLQMPDRGLPWEQSRRVVLATQVVRHCDFAPIREALEQGHVVAALSLPGFAGLLNHPTQPGVTFARELADRVRVIACPRSRPFLLHSDIRDYGLAPSQWRTLRRRLRADQGDCTVIVWGELDDVATAVREVFIRAREALIGIPAETRQAFADGTNGFERILPGPDRMYPDTDTPPLPIADHTINLIRAQLPEPLWDRERRYLEAGLEPVAASELALAPWADLFDGLRIQSHSIARRIADTLRTRIPHLRRRRGLRVLPPADRVQPLVDDLVTSRVRMEATERAFDALVELPDRTPDQVLETFRSAEGDRVDLARRVARVATEADALNGLPQQTVLRWAMGQVMPHVLGKTPPETVRESLMAALGRARIGGTDG